MTDDEMVLGYLVDEIWLRDLARHANVIGKPNPARLALYPESIHRRFIQHHEFSALCLIGRRIIEKLDIFGLTMCPVWISNSESCLCWSFPYSMHPSNRSPQDKVRLAYFKEVTGMEGELQWWPSLDGDVPPEMQDMDKPREDYWQMSICSQPGYERGSMIDFSSAVLPGIRLSRDKDGRKIYPPPFITEDELENQDENSPPSSAPSSPLPSTNIPMFVSDSEDSDSDLELDSADCESDAGNPQMEGAYF